MKAINLTCLKCLLQTIFINLATFYFLAASLEMFNEKLRFISFWVPDIMIYLLETKQVFTK